MNKIIVLCSLVLVLLTGCGKANVPIDLIEEGFQVETDESETVYTFIQESDLSTIGFAYHVGLEPSDSGMGLYVSTDEIDYEYEATLTGEVYCDNNYDYYESIAECNSTYSLISELSNELGVEKQMESIVNVYENESGLKF